MSSQATIQPCSGDWAGVRASLSSSLAMASVADCGRAPLDQLVEAGPVAADQALAVAAVVQLLLDGGHLAAQHGLALLLAQLLLQVLAQLAPHPQLGQRLAGPAQHQAQAGLDVGRLQHLDLLLEGQVGGVEGQVGHGVGVVQAGDRVGQLSGAPLFEDLLDDDPVLGDQPVDLGAGDEAGGHRLDVDPQRLAEVAATGAEHGPLEPAHDQAAGAAGQLAVLFDLGHGADLGVAAVDPGDEQHAAVRPAGVVGRGSGLGGLEGDGDDHLGSHDAGGQGQDGQGANSGVSHSGHFLHIDPIGPFRTAGSGYLRFTTDSAVGLFRWLIHRKHLALRPSSAKARRSVGRGA